MKSILTITIASLVAATSASALPFLSTEHVDIGIAFEAGAFDLHIHNETDDIEYAPDEAILQVNPQAFELIPNDPNYSFLGTIGVDHVWRLPKTPNPALLYLGFGAEEIAPGTLDGDAFTISLLSVTHGSGGKFAVYDVDAFNNPAVIFNSGDGITGADSFVFPTGGHADYNWTFSQEGDYAVEFKVDGLDGGTPVTSTATYTFTVVPEPTSAALLAGGVIGLLARRRRSVLV